MKPTETMPRINPNARSMYRMLGRDNLIVFAEITRDGYAQLEHIRLTDPNFHRRRIIPVLQMHPELTTPGKVQRIGL